MPEPDYGAMGALLGKLQDKVRHLETGGGGGDNGGMDEVIRRVAALEDGLKDVRGTLSRLEPMLARIDERLRDMPTGKDFGELRGKVSNLPTTLQLIGFVVAVVVASGLIKYVAP